MRDPNKHTYFRQSIFPTVYTIYFLKYIDQILWAIKLRPVWWTKSGHLCHIHSKNGSTWGVEASTHFPHWVWYTAIWIRRKWLWVRYQVGKFMGYYA